MADHEYKKAAAHYLVNEENWKLEDVAKLFGVSKVAIFFWLNPEKRNEAARKFQKKLRLERKLRNERSR